MTTNKIAIILLGDSGVGKTSLALRFVSEQFRARPPKTLVKSFKKTVTVGKDRTVELYISDISGLKEHRTFVPNFYEKAEGALLVYDVTNEATFTQLNSWLDEFKSYNKAAHIMIVGNKIEDPAKKSVADNTLRDYAKEKDLECMEASAESGENVNTVFLSLAEKILRSRDVLLLSDDHALSKSEKTSEKSVVILDGATSHNSASPHNSRESLYCEDSTAMSALEYFENIYQENCSIKDPEKELSNQKPSNILTEKDKVKTPDARQTFEQQRNKKKCIIL